MSRALHATLFAAVLIAAGCAPASRTSPRITTPEACQPARVVLVVRNETGYDLDIMQHERRSGTTRLLTMVSVGRHEVDIPNDAMYSYSARHDGATVTGIPFAWRKDVTLEIECRNG
jgi:hypothetical protein